MFLEKGNARAGLEHILARHADDFERIGVDAGDVSATIFKAIRENNVVGTLGSGRNIRTIYQTVIDGVERRIAVGAADNGFIVTAHPVSF